MPYLTSHYAPTLIVNGNSCPISSSLLKKTEIQQFLTAKVRSITKPGLMLNRQFQMVLTTNYLMR